MHRGFRRKEDIACLQEVKWRGQETQNIGEGFKLCWSGSKEAANGVAIVVYSSFVDKFLEVKRVSDRLKLLKTIIGQTIFTVVSAYAPETGRAENEKTAFIEKLNTVLNNVDAINGEGD